MRSRRFRFAALATLAASLSCGAKSGLTIPCAVPVESVTPRIVIVLEHGNGWFRYGPSPARLFIADTFTGTESTAEVALYVTDRDNQARDPSRYCDAPTDLRLPFGATVDAMVAELMPLDDVGAYPYQFNVPAYEGLRVARSALEQSGSDAARTVVWMTTGDPSCVPEVGPADCFCPAAPVSECLRPPRGGDGPNSCEDYPRIRALLGEMAFEDIRTFVVTSNLVISGWASFTADLSALAAVGGLAREPPAQAFFDRDGPSEFRAALVAEIERGRCYLRATQPAPSAPEYSLVRVDGVELRHDSSRQDGWDWTDRRRGTLRIWGPTCDRFVSDRQSVRLIARMGRCEI